MPTFSEFKRGRWVGAAFPFAIFVLNAYLCRELFFLEYSKFLGSIEAAYISISRYLMDNWHDLSWFNLWYCGIPYQNTYPPLLHWIVAATGRLLQMSPAHAHHLVSAFFYCLGGVSIYALVLRLAKSQWTAFGAGIFYSLLTPSALLMNSVWRDLETPLGPRRLQALIVYGEGPNIAALALLPLAIVCLDIAVMRRRPLSIVFASVSMAAVALTNWLGTFALALAVASYLLANLTFPIWRNTIGIGVLAYLFALPWIPPSTIRAIQFNAQTIGGDYRGIYAQMPARLAAGFCVLILLKLLFRRFKVSPGVQTTVFYTLLTASIALLAEWANLFLVPQPHRYHLNMDQAVTLAVFCGLSGFGAALPRWSKALGISLLLMGCYFQIHAVRKFAHNWIQPIDMTATSEYRIAQWFDRNMQGARVMAAGPPSYWMNAFTNTPQLGGGFDQGVTNPQARLAHYIIVSGENAGGKDGEIAVLWMRAFAIQAVAVARAGEPFRNPRKFDGILPLEWEDRGDRIFRVPLRSSSLAHIVRRSDLVDREPVNGLDVDLIRRYDAALEDPSLPAATWRWTSRHTAEISADLSPGQIVSVQQSFHPGWRATVNGTARKISADSLGFIAIDPDCTGPCRIELSYDGGLEMKIARWLSVLSVAGSCFWVFATAIRREA